MKKPYLLSVALAVLAVFFGWRTMQALEGRPAAGDTAAGAAATGWQPAAPAPDPSPPRDMTTAVAAVKSRPLFRADRKPYAEGGTVSGRNFDAELSRLSLIGIVSFGDDLRGVVVSKGAPRTERWEVKAGDDLAGFRVKEVRTDGLTVTAENREFLLPLYAGSPTATGGGPVRTEATRREPSPAQPAAAQPRPGTPPVQRGVTPQPAPSQLRQPPQAPPAAQPVTPTVPRPAPPFPRYIPGRR